MFRRLLISIPLLLAIAVPSVPALLPSATASASVAAVPEVSGDGVVVMEGKTGEILYAKNPHQRFAPASITKILTAVVAIENADLDTVYPIDIDSVDLAIRTDSTTMGLYPGERVSLRNLLYGLMLPSGNDAAIEIARNIAGSEANFIDMMNAKAAAIGMANSHFMNPHGLDHDLHYTTAYDMTLLGRYAMGLPDLAEIVSKRTRIFYGYDGRKLYQLGNLDRHIGSDGYDGIKIGYTERAWSTYVGTAVRNNRRLFVTVLHSSTWASDGERLFDHFFAR